MDTESVISETVVQKYMIQQHTRYTVGIFINNPSFFVIAAYEISVKDMEYNIPLDFATK